MAAEEKNCIVIKRMKLKWILKNELRVQGSIVKGWTFNKDREI